MEVFRELYVTADRDRMAALVEQIERSLPEGWTRDTEAEDNIRSSSTRPRPTYCFSRTRDEKRLDAIVVLAQKDSEKFHVSNIIPTARHRLSHTEYNFILEEFYQQVLRGTAERLGLGTTMTGANLGLENWMSRGTAEKLRQFSACANKNTGSSHPQDRERWNDFVLSAHEEDSALDPSTLQRWLIEAEGWPPEVAEQLAIEYESGRELLGFAKAHRQSA